MKTEIPEFLLEMSKQINEQNNRMTADPLFEVRYKKHLVTEKGYNESHWEIASEDGSTLYHSEKSENLDVLADYLFYNHEEWVAEFLGEHNDGLETTDSGFKLLLNENFDPEWNDLPDGCKKFHMQEVEVTVNSHFTEADAQAFIDRKQHDYPKLYIYAISLCYCWNMAELRRWIKSLSETNNA